MRPRNYRPAGSRLGGGAAQLGPQETNRMATTASTQNLPLFYKAIEPLNVTQHGKMKVRAIPATPEISATHAIPLTVDEFTLVQRHYPIVFSIGESPIPMALMGLNEGVNVFLSADGRPLDTQTYI